MQLKKRLLGPKTKLRRRHYRRQNDTALPCKPRQTRQSRKGEMKRKSSDLDRQDIIYAVQKLTNP